MVAERGQIRSMATKINPPNITVLSYELYKQELLACSAMLRTTMKKYIAFFLLKCIT